MHWPPSNFSDSNVLSTPMCLDEHKQLNVKRCVKDIGWVPETVKCHDTQDHYEKAVKCPPNYRRIADDLCVLLHTRQPWMSGCEDSLVPFSMYNMSRPELVALFDYLRDYAPEKMFWMPAKQTNVNKSMQIGSIYTIDEVGLQWTMPAYYGEQVITNDNCPSCNFSEHGGCLAFNPILNRDGRFNSSVINCNLNFLHSFCLFKKNESLHSLACPDGYMAPLMPIYRNNECLAIKHFDPMPVKDVKDTLIDEYCLQHQAYLLDSVESTFRFERFANKSLLSSNERCLFGANRRKVLINETSFVGLLSVNEIHFVNWDSSMGLRDFKSDTYHVLAANYLGKWFWESTTVSCIICSFNVAFQLPKLVLRYDSVRTKLALQVTNREFLMTRITNNLKFMCFAKVHNQYTANLQVAKLTNDTEPIYDIQIIGPGNYWCTGFVISLATRLDTDTVFANGIVMSMFVEFECQPNRCFNFEIAFESFLYTRSANATWIIDPTHIQIEGVNLLDINYPHGTTFVSILFQVSVNIINEAALRTEPNLLNLSDEMLTYYYVRQKFLLISNLHDPWSEFRIRSVNSTNFCLPSSISVLSEINWMGARINETIKSVERCFMSNGWPLRRRCIGDRFFGAQWLRLSSESHCNVEDFSDITNGLQHLVNGFDEPEQSVEIIENLTTLMTNSSDRLVRMDIFFVSRIMGRISEFLHTSTLTIPSLKNLVFIYNSLMQVENAVARSSATFNSTNVLLESLELILITEIAGVGNVLNMAQPISVEEEPVISQEEGIVVSVSAMLINFVIDPMLTDVSGIALLKKHGSRKFGMDASGLKDYTVRYLYRNQSMHFLLFQTNLEVASFLPQQLLADILRVHPDAKLVFTIFYNDVLFQTTENTTYVRSDGKIIAVTVPGLDQLPGILPIYIKPASEDHIADACGYWDFNYVDGWSETGCYLIAQSPLNFSTIVLCGCNHLTHFAYLLKGNSSQLGEMHLRSLHGITLIGCTLSLIGIIGIYITAIQFRSWRAKTSTKYLLQLSTAIAFQMVLLAFVNTADVTQQLLSTDNEAWCVVIGVLLHYFVLAMFFWMLIIAYLQFIRYVIVFNHLKTSRFLLKSSILGWTLPMVPVLFVVAIDSSTYIPDLDISVNQICYPSGNALYFGILLPIGVIVGANLVIFILVNYNLLRGTNAVCRAGDRNSKLSQLRLSIFLFFLLGLTWIFGLMSTAFAETSIVFSYLFCLTSTFQGFVMFLYFVIMDPVARNLWVYFFKRLCCSKRGNIDIRKDSTSKGSY